jgi:ribonuclease HI
VISTTIISDASFCGQTGIASYSAWMKCDGKDSILNTGVFKKHLSDSTMAEVRAVANAFAFATSCGYVERGTEVLIQCDNMTALAVVMLAVPSAVDRKHPDGLAIVKIRKPKTVALFQPAVQVIKTVVAEYGLTVAVRHVRGHKAGGGRQAVNRRVDREARRAMQRVRLATKLKKEEAADA